MLALRKLPIAKTRWQPVKTSHRVSGLVQHYIYSNAAFDWVKRGRQGAIGRGPVTQYWRYSFGPKGERVTSCRAIQ